MTKFSQSELQKSIFFVKGKDVLPFWPVMKLTHSPNSIWRLLWHMKFSTLILRIVPDPERCLMKESLARAPDFAMAYRVLGFSLTRLKQIKKEQVPLMRLLRAGKRLLLYVACILLTIFRRLDRTMMISRSYDRTQMGPIRWPISQKKKGLLG